MTRQDIINKYKTDRGIKDDYKLSDDENYLIDVIQRAINYTRCSLQLKDKETMTFQEYLKGLGWEQLSDSFVYKQGNNYKDIEELRKEYIKEYNL